MKHFGKRVPVLAGLVVVGWMSPAWAKQDAAEGRIKTDIDYNVLARVTRKVKLRPMIKVEQRYRGEGLVLLKVFVGVRLDVLPWLLVFPYYAHKDKFSGNQVSRTHMAVLSLLPHYKFWRLKLSDKNEFEWHSNPGFFRYRNKPALFFRPGPKWLWLFVDEEFRVDADAGRINQNDVCAGIQFGIQKHLSLRLYYDFEAKRRGSDRWQRTHVGALILFVRL